MMALADRIHIAERFQRAVRIDWDVNNPAALSGFICPQSSSEVLELLARHISESNQGAFTWTGPYGSGKSSLVVALSLLLGGTSRVRKRAASAIGERTAKKVWAALPPKTKGWQILPVVARRERPINVIGGALEESGLLKKRAPKEWDETLVLSALGEIATQQSKNGGGLIVFIDEMGKFLEAAAHEGTDLYLLQQFAELASRSRGKLIFIGILHQAFEEYANRISREVRDEWAKIQGRFVDIAINVTGDEQIYLLSQAIESSRRPPEHKDRAMAVAKMAHTDNTMALAKTLEECWPLHPLVALLLGPISRRRFGQNQRSIFGFLNSSEPEGFQDFLKTADGKSLYTVERLWDYLKINLEPSILASPDGHRWALATDAVARCEASIGQEHHLRLLKIIALIDLFRERTRLKANIELLRCAMPGISPRKVRSALSELEKGSFLIFRKFTDAYAIFEGSDFDIDQAMAGVSGSSPEIDFSELNELAGLHPIIAKRHYHKSGSLRWFDLTIISLNQLEEYVTNYHPTNGAIGVFLFAIPTENETEKKAQKICEKARRKSKDWDIVVGYSPDSWNITSLGRELMAIESVRQGVPELHGDRVARAEVRARITAVRSQLEVEINRAFRSAWWHRKNYSPQRLSVAELNSLASEMADARFHKAPRLHNELLNRLKPSSSAVAAQNLLLRRMTLNEGEPRLGIKGFPAEGGLFASFLEATRLYRNGAISEPEENDDPCNLRPVLEEARQLLGKNNDRALPMSEIYKKWKEQPYGIKDGILPILGAAFILSQRKNTALYRQGIFQAHVSELDMEYLASKHPEDIQLRWMKLSVEARSLLSELADVIQELDEKESLTGMEPIDIGRGLVALHDRLPGWTGRTQHLSDNAKKVRQIFKQARDPNKLIFDDLPKLLNGSGSNGTSSALQKASELVREGLIELREAYPNMLGRLRNLLLEELEIPNSSSQNFAELHARANNIRNLGGDHRLEAFVVHLTKFDATDTIMEHLASMALNKPARDWVDNDIDRARIELAELARKFIRAEAYAHVKGRKNKRSAIAVIIGLDRGSTTTHGEFDITDLDHGQVKKLVQSLEGVLKGGKGNNKRLALAALAQLTAKHLRGIQKARAPAKVRKSAQPLEP